MKQPAPEDFGLTPKSLEGAKRLVDEMKRLGRTVSRGIYISAPVCGLLLGATAPDYVGVSDATAVWIGVLTASFIALIGVLLSDGNWVLYTRHSRKRDAVDALREYQLALRQYEAWAYKCEIDYWKSLSGREFESEIATIFAKQGFQVNLTPYGRDRGVDIWLVADGRRIAVQCKQHSKAIGVAVARDLYGAMTDAFADEAIIVSTSGFTTGTMEFVSGKPIRLFDLEKVLQLHRNSDDQIDLLPLSDEDILLRAKSLRVAASRFRSEVSAGTLSRAESNRRHSELEDAIARLDHLIVKRRAEEEFERLKAEADSLSPEERAAAADESKEAIAELRRLGFDIRD